MYYKNSFKSSARRTNHGLVLLQSRSQVTLCYFVIFFIIKKEDVRSVIKSPIILLKFAPFMTSSIRHLHSKILFQENCLFSIIHWVTSIKKYEINKNHLQIELNTQHLVLSTILIGLFFMRVRHSLVWQIRLFLCSFRYADWVQPTDPWQPLFSLLSLQESLVQPSGKLGQITLNRI